MDALEAWRVDSAGADWQDLSAVLSGQPSQIKAMPFFIGQSVNGEGEVEIGADSAHIVVNHHDLAERGLTVKEGDTIFAYEQEFKVNLAARDRSLGISRCDVRAVKSENTKIDRGKNFL